MYNVFQNIKVESAKTDSSQGQFRYEVKLVRAFQDGKHGLVTDKEFVIDTTDDLSECLEVAQRMIRTANKAKSLHLKYSAVVNFIGAE